MQNYNLLFSCDGKSSVKIVLTDISSIKSIEPIHIVLLACLRQLLFDKGYTYANCHLSLNNPELLKFFDEDINLGKYWKNNNPINHTDSNDETIFNLWRVVESDIDSYSRGITDYLKIIILMIMIYLLFKMLW